MGIDGFSMGNLGLNADLTAAQTAGQAQLEAQKEAEVKVKQLDSSNKEDGVKRKKDDEGSNSQSEYEENDSNDEPQEDDEHQEKSNLKDEDFKDANFKKFKIRVNQASDKIELVNKDNEKVIEEIKAKELMNVMSKLDYASGVFVNKKI